MSTFRRRLSVEAPHRINNSPPFVPFVFLALGLCCFKHRPSLALCPGPLPDRPRGLSRSISPGCPESSLTITKQENDSVWFRVRCHVTRAEVVQQDNAFGGMCTTRPKGSPANVNVGLNSHFARGFNRQLSGRSQKQHNDLSMPFLHAAIEGQAHRTLPTALPCKRASPSSEQGPGRFNAGSRLGSLHLLMSRASPRGKKQERTPWSHGQHEPPDTCYFSRY